MTSNEQRLTELIKAQSKYIYSLEDYLTKYNKETKVFVTNHDNYIYRQDISVAKNAAAEPILPF